jgi:hypothetical protein
MWIGLASVRSEKMRIEGEKPFVQSIRLKDDGTAYSDARVQGQSVSAVICAEEILAVELSETAVILGFDLMAGGRVFNGNTFYVRNTSNVTLDLHPELLEIGYKKPKKTVKKKPKPKVEAETEVKPNAGGMTQSTSGTSVQELSPAGV